MAVSRLSELATAVDGLSADERSRVEAYLLGYLSAAVTEDAWAHGLAAALKLVK